MKKRLVPIVTVTLAILVVGSIAYAADKKKRARLTVHEPNEMSEEALKAELLAASEGQQEKTAGSKPAGSGRSAAAAAKEKIK